MSFKIKATKPNDFLFGTNTTRRLNPRENPLYRVVQRAMPLTVGSKGIYHSAMGASDDIYVYHAEKVRAKFKQEVTYFGKNSKSAGQIKQKKSVKVRDGGWKIRVFKFPYDRVISVKQHSRHFDIVLK